MLGTQAFVTLGRRPYYLKPTANYPWDWILPQLRKACAEKVHEARRGVATRDAFASDHRHSRAQLNGSLRHGFYWLPPIFY